MTGKMTAWEKRLNVEGLVKTERDIPSPKANEVLLKVLAVGICGTDLNIYRGTRVVADHLIPGHEFIGEVIEVGSNVTEFKVGQKAVPSCVYACGKCFQCLQGNESQCENLLEVGIHIDGGFAEYVAVPEKVLHHVPQDMNSIVGASIEPVAVAYCAVRKIKKFIPGRDVLIYGPGPIGAYITQMMKNAGASKIVVCGMGVDELRLKFMKEKYGVETVNLEKEDLKAKLAEYFPKNHGKADFILESTGATKAFDGMLENLAPHGEMVFVSVPHSNAEINMARVVMQEFTLQGTFCYHLDEFEFAIKMVEAGQIDFDGIVKEFTLDTLDEGFKSALSRQTMKSVAMVSR